MGGDRLDAHALEAELAERNRRDTERDAGEVHRNVTHPELEPRRADRADRAEDEVA